MRAARKQSESNVYHVVTRGTGRQLIFEDDSDRMFFLSLVKQACRDHSCTLYAWCLMSNHVHLLLKAPIANVSAFMHWVCGRYAQHFNHVHERVGHLFQDRFWSEPVDGDEAFLAVLRYIHQNPEKPGIAKMEEYPWSSYREYAGKSTRKLLCEIGLALDLLGGVDSFDAFHRIDDKRFQWLDVDEKCVIPGVLSTAAALEAARKATGYSDLSSIKALERSERNGMLRMMWQAGISIRQIERLTGVSRGIIQDVI